MYCTQLVLTGVLALANLGLISFLLLTDYRAYRTQSASSRDYLLKSKTWILALGWFMYLLQFLREFFQPQGSGYFSNGSLWVCEGLKYLIYMFVFYYFIKQSTLLLNSSQVHKWRTLIKYITICSGVAYVCYGVYFLVNLITKQSTKEFCHTLNFILGGTL